MVERNEFIDDDNLTELSSLTHLLDKNYTDSDDTEEAIVIKHSPYFSETSFINLLASNEGLTERFVDELNVFVQAFSSFLNSLQDLNRTSFVCGDFNINMLEINSNTHYNGYFESIYSKGFFPRITLPTRIQPPSFSLIDSILCNSLDYATNSVSGVIITDTSDHKMIFTVYPNNSLKQKIDKFIEIEKRDQL